MVDPKLKEQIAFMFRARDFESMWYLLSEQYTRLGFTDPLTDQQKIDEYKWIVQQLRKYMFSKQDAILSCNSIGEMIDAVDAMIGNSAEYGEERKKVVYNFMRDHWLLEVRNYLSNMFIDIMMEDEETEEENNEWAD